MNIKALKDAFLKMNANAARQKRVLDATLEHIAMLEQAIEKEEAEAQKVEPRLPLTDKNKK